MTPETIRILGVPVTPQRFSGAVQVIVAAARERRRIRVHFCTVHTIVEATENRELLAALESGDIRSTDGMPLVWLARRRGAPEAERVAGPDVMLAVCNEGRRAGLRHYFYGGQPGTPETLARKLAARYPGIEIAGMHSPPFGPISAADQADMIDAINSSNADVVWVGLGSPKQDIWAARHAAALTPPVIATVGAAFDMHSGRLRRAPGWMQGIGLEWVFRLLMEPRRLWRRYLRTNFKFVWRVGAEALARRLPPS